MPSSRPRAKHCGLQRLLEYAVGIQGGNGRQRCRHECAHPFAACDRLLVPTDFFPLHGGSISWWKDCNNGLFKCNYTIKMQ